MRFVLGFCHGLRRRHLFWVFVVGFVEENCLAFLSWDVVEGTWQTRSSCLWSAFFLQNMDDGGYLLTVFLDLFLALRGLLLNSLKKSPSNSVFGSSVPA